MGWEGGGKDVVWLCFWRLVGGQPGFWLFSLLQQDDSYDFDGGRVEGGPFLLTFLQVFVGIVEKFEKVRGFGCGESGHSAQCSHSCLGGTCLQVVDNVP